MAKSYFAILGVTSNASSKEIQSAYRRLPKEFHPDHYPGGNEIFRKIQEAYSVLGNPVRRTAYESGSQHQQVLFCSAKSGTGAIDY